VFFYLKILNHNLASIDISINSLTVTKSSDAVHKYLQVSFKVRPNFFHVSAQGRLKTKEKSRS